MATCYVPSNFILSIGGDPGLKTVEYHDLTSNSWHNLPDLNIGRDAASACYLANHVYVFCGMDSNGEYLDSIESLCVENLE